jgi:hypothetical protein
MKNFRINTTAFEDEDLLITTDLSEKQIIEVIKPIVEAERNGDEFYDNSDLINALSIAYPGNYLEYSEESYIKI